VRYLKETLEHIPFSMKTYLFKEVRIFLNTYRKQMRLDYVAIEDQMTIGRFSLPEESPIFIIYIFY